MHLLSQLSPPSKISPLLFRERKLLSLPSFLSPSPLASKVNGKNKTPQERLNS